MSKVIFFVRPMHGHVNPTLELVSELARRGEDILYYTTGKFQEKIEPTGAACRIYPESGKRLKSGPDPGTVDPAESPGQGENPGKNTSFEEKVKIICTKLATHLEDVKIQDQDLYEQVKAENPDYIIYDYLEAFWGKMLARKLGVPALASIPSFALCDKLVEKDPEGSIKYILQMNPHEPPFSNQSIGLRDLIDFISARMSSTFQIKDFDMLNYGNSELLNIVYNSRYFQPYGEVFDDTFLFVGCRFDTGSGTADFPYERLGEKPIIFISLGTNFNRREDFYKECIKAFAGIDKQVVLAAGTRIDTAGLGKIPGNFIVRDFVPQLEILKRSGLFITHGGLNSVKEGIYFNVPLIVFPQHGDQFAVAHQVNRLGAGICFENSNLTAPELRKAADKVYANEIFRQNIEKIKESFEKAGGAKRAADEIFKLKEKIGIA